TAMRSRPDRGLMIFDLSNPRTVDERVETIHGVKLVTMDQIAELAGKNLRSRMTEFQAAEELVKKEMVSADSSMKRMKAEPSIVSIFKNADAIRQRELNKAFALLSKDGRITQAEAKTIEQLSYALVEGIMSAPMNNLRKIMAEDGNSQDSDEMLRLVSRLFRYENEQPADSQQ
ncbi:MAG TPA: glutamyl-tRNA reductase, partial [Nitrososphaera sp.]|nr:glutamyl-tRNA reductase [Nitrososphaera sp.]